MEQADSAQSDGQNRQRKQAIVAAIESISTVTEDQHGFKESMLHVMNSSYMSATESKEALIELFLPETVTFPSCLKMPALYHHHLREVLRFSGISVEQRQGFFVPQAIANALFLEEETLRNIAITLISEFRLSGGRAGSSTAPVSSDTSGNRRFPGPPEGESTWRKVDATTRRFTDSEKYRGILAESPNLAEARNAYMTYCSQKGFARSDRVKLVSAVLKGPALSYWMSHIDSREEFSELGSVFKQLKYQFDTPAHQRQIESLAISLSLEDIKRKHNCNRVAALGMLYHEVARLNEQFPKVKRGDSFRTQTRMKIIEKYEWSRTTEEEVMQDALKYDALYTKLSASLVIWELEVSRSGRDPDATDDRRNTHHSKSLIGYGAQYINPVTKFRTRRDSSIPASTNPSRRRTMNTNSQRRAPDSSSRPQSRPLRFSSNNSLKTRCFKCGRIGHWRAQCTFNDSQSMLNAARRRIRETNGNPDATAARILFELCQKKTRTMRQTLRRK